MLLDDYGAWTSTASLTLPVKGVRTDSFPFDRGRLEFALILRWKDEGMGVICIYHD